jgi:HTH-like domain
MRFRLVDAAKKDFPVQRLCKVLGVSMGGYFAWKDRPACRRQREDMVLLAHVRSAFAASNETYGSPRMVHELRGDGLAVGRRRVARLMRENGMRRGRSGASGRPPTVSIPSRSPPISFAKTSTQRGRTRSGAPTSPTSGPARAGCTLPSSSTYSAGASSAGQPAIGSIRN